MTTVNDLETQLNAMISSGKILEALDAFFADDASFQEGNGPLRVGKKQNHAHLSAFFATLKKFNGATLHAQSVQGDISFSEWTFDMVGPDGPIVWNEILRRRWQGGKVVSERYYQAT